jgi:hypothetical protein
MFATRSLLIFFPPFRKTRNRSRYENRFAFAEPQAQAKIRELEKSIKREQARYGFKTTTTATAPSFPGSAEPSYSGSLSPLQQSSPIPDAPMPPVPLRVGFAEGKANNGDIFENYPPLKHELQHKVMVGEFTQQFQNTKDVFKKNPYMKTVIPAQDIKRKFETMATANRMLFYPPPVNS